MHVELTGLQSSPDGGIAVHTRQGGHSEAGKEPHLYDQRIQNDQIEMQTKQGNGATVMPPVREKELIVL